MCSCPTSDERRQGKSKYFLDDLDHLKDMLLMPNKYIAVWSVPPRCYKCTALYVACHKYDSQSMHRRLLSTCHFLEEIKKGTISIENCNNIS
jgi:hypothetical protein